MEDKTLKFNAKDNVEKREKITEKQNPIESKSKSKNKNELLSELHKFEEETANVVFGKSEGRYNASTFFKVSDSQIFENTDLRISSLQKRYREDEKLKKKRKKEFTTSLQEFIDKGKENTIEITVNNLSLDCRANKDCAFFTKDIKDIHKHRNLNKIFSAINKLSSDFLTFEIDRLEKFKKEYEASYNREKLGSYHIVLEELNKKLNEIEANSAIACIGFGKSVFMNTVLLAIRLLNCDIFTDIIKILHPRHPQAKYFPISNYTTSINSKDYPLGWVKITNINKNLPDFELSNLNQGDTIQGALIERGSSPKVQISINGAKQIIHANGLSKYEK